MNNSWLHLKNKNSNFSLENNDAALDVFEAKDCGWVEQMRPFIKQFSNRGDTVLDPFCGFASTLVAAELEGRAGVGIELDENRTSIANHRLIKLNLKNSIIIQGDAEVISQTIEPVDLIISNIPYFGCNWSKDQFGQLYDISNYNDYLQKMRACLKAFKLTLKKSGYIILMVENIRVGDHFVALAQDIQSMLNECFSFIDERILIYDKPLANTSNIISNRAHEYAFIAQNAPKSINLLQSKLILERLSKLYPEIIVYGSFARWLDKKESEPSDVDILLPNNVSLIQEVTIWFMNKGFKITRWGAPIEKAAISTAIVTTNYFRAEYIDSTGVFILFDIFFPSSNKDHEKFLNKSIMQDGVRSVLEDVIIDE